MLASSPPADTHTHTHTHTGLVIEADPTLTLLIVSTWIWTCRVPGSGGSTRTCCSAWDQNRCDHVCSVDKQRQNYGWKTLKMLHDHICTSGVTDSLFGLQRSSGTSSRTNIWPLAWSSLSSMFVFVRRCNERSVRCCSRPPGSRTPCVWSTPARVSLSGRGAPRWKLLFLVLIVSRERLDSAPGCWDLLTPDNTSTRDTRRRFKSDPRD